ncbi:MAG: ATP-dependent sacrificial sulfur transferase LarE [Desulfovibrionaceae bacterium]
MSDQSLDAGYAALCDAIRPLRDCVVAFSGGVDSSLVLRATLDCLPRERVLAVTLAAPYTPEVEVRAAKDLAQRLGAPHEIVPVAFPEFLRDNPPDRCYRCKRLLFGLLLDKAARTGLPHLLDGTNADDLGASRPGLRAVRELGVASPLAMAGLTKPLVRALAREHGLPNWDAPAGACLLTRLPHGEQVEEMVLRRIEAGETVLREAGFPGARLRNHGELARIEVAPERIAALVATADERNLDAALKDLGYRHVTVDLAGYRTASATVPEADEPTRTS